MGSVQQNISFNLGQLYFFFQARITINDIKCKELNLIKTLFSFQARKLGRKIKFWFQFNIEKYWIKINRSKNLKHFSLTFTSLQITEMQFLYYSGCKIWNYLIWIKKRGKEGLDILWPAVILLKLLKWSRSIYHHTWP